MEWLLEYVYKCTFHHYSLFTNSFIKIEFMIYVGGSGAHNPSEDTYFPSVNLQSSFYYVLVLNPLTQFTSHFAYATSTLST